jgi:hypothetical protein
MAVSTQNCTHSHITNYSSNIQPARYSVNLITHKKWIY